MTISLTLVPNTTTRPSTIDAIAMGLGGGSRYNVRLDGSTIATARATKGGVLAVGVAISSTARFGSHTVELRDSANKVTLASAAFSVQAVVEPPPPPPPPPPPTGMTYTDYRIPSNIDRTGTSDVYGDLGRWIQQNVPDGADATHHSRILPFDAASKYLIVSENPEAFGLLQGGFQMKRRNHITIDGGGRWRDVSQFDRFTPDAAGAAAYAAFDPAAAWLPGARIDHRSPGRGGFSALFFAEDTTDIRVTGWTVDGGDANVGKPHLGTPAELAEQRSLFYVRFGSDGTEFDNNFADRGAGFGLWAAADSGHSASPPRNVKDHHNYIRGYETHPGYVTVVNGESFRNIIKDATGSAFDIEPERAGDQAVNVSIHDNVYDTYSWGALRSCWFASIVPAVPTVTMKGIKVARNLIVKGPATAQNGNYPGQGGFCVRMDSTNVKEDVEITDNYSLDDQTMAAGGGRASVKVANVKNLRITGNRQVLSGGAPLIYPPSGLTGTVVLEPNP